MNNIKAGINIQSTSSLDGTIFENTTIQILKHNEAGSIGFVLNKAFGKNLNDLIEFSHANPFSLMDGGPVDRDHLFVVHKRPDLIEEGEQLNNGFFLGGNMEQVVAAINKGLLNEKDIQLFIGYCGWDVQELEAELEEGSWEIIN